ncbi:MAG TPA: nitroreductase family protein [Spirochaetales bacterium]|nr:nitroreductase family protein [Spirochaetales bacterium]
MEDLVPELEKRRAKRALSEKPIPQEVVERILKAAILAPSCFNNQPWRFIVAQDPESLSKVKSCLSSNNKWATASPLIILVATKADLDCKLEGEREYALFDTGMAVMALQLQAIREGLYAHPIAGYQVLDLKRAFHIPNDFVLIALIILGYPGPETLLTDKQKEQETAERLRKPLSEVVSYNTWNFPT